LTRFLGEGEKVSRGVWEVAGVRGGRLLATEHQDLRVRNRTIKKRKK